MIKNVQPYTVPILYLSDKKTDKGSLVRFMRTTDDWKQACKERDKKEGYVNTEAEDYLDKVFGLGPNSGWG